MIFLALVSATPKLVSVVIRETLESDSPLGASTPQAGRIVLLRAPCAQQTVCSSVGLDALSVKRGMVGEKSTTKQDLSTPVAYEGVI